MGTRRQRKESLASLSLTACELGLGVVWYEGVHVHVSMGRRHGWNPLEGELRFLGMPSRMVRESTQLGAHSRGLEGGRVKAEDGLGQAQWISGACRGCAGQFAGLRGVSAVNKAEHGWTTRLRQRSWKRARRQRSSLPPSGQWMCGRPSRRRKVSPSRCGVILLPLSPRRTSCRQSVVSLRCRRGGPAPGGHGSARVGVLHGPGVLTRRWAG